MIKSDIIPREHYDLKNYDEGSRHKSNKVHPHNENEKKTQKFGFSS